MALLPEDLVAMVSFARVVEGRSFTAAAHQLRVAKSVVSARVSALESRLGVRLLHRNTRKLSLTTEGVSFYEHCAALNRTLVDASEVAEEVGDALAGTLRVSTTASFHDAVLCAATIGFLREHPRLHVDVSVGNEVVDLVERRVDVAFRLAPSLSGASLVARRLGGTPKIACAAPSYVEARGMPRSAADLASHDCLRFSVVPLEAEWAFATPHVAPRGQLRVPLASDSAETIHRAALAGLGVAVFPRFQVAADLEAGRLVQVLEDAPFKALGLFAVHAHGGRAPRRVRAFVDHVAAQVATPEWQLDAPHAHAHTHGK